MRTSLISRILFVVLLVFILIGIAFLSKTFSNNEIAEIVGTIQGDKKVYEIDGTSNNFSINIPAYDVKILSTTEKPRVELYNYDEADVIISTYENKCNIEIDRKSIFNFIFIKNPRVIIYLPEEELEQLELNISAGKVEVNTIEAKNLKVKVSAGSAKIQNCDFENIDAKVSAGKLSLYASNSLKNLKSKVSAGGIELYYPKENDGFKLEYSVSAGSFDNESCFKTTSKDKNNGVIDYNSDKNENSCKMDINVSAGSFEFDDYQE